ncbi:MAG: UDP-glucose 4-epimerase [Candidatus Nitrosomirales archaeon]|jgi:UDP-glucose 4-epimerase
MKILVTGGAGFIGSNLAEKLAESHEVTVLDDLYLGRKENLDSADMEFVKGSVMNEGLVSKACKDCDYVFHNAAMSSSPMFKELPKLGMEVNVLGFMNVMKAAKENGVKKVIYASTSSLYSGNPLPYSETQPITAKTFYEASFRTREIVAQTYYFENDVSSIGLRYFSVYGPKELHKGRYANNISQFLWDLMQGKPAVIYGDGTQSRDFTFVGDVVSANLLAMTSKIDFGVFNVGTSIATSFNELVALINKLLDTSIQPVHVDNPIKNYVHDTIADLSLVSKSLGYKPQWTLEKGIKFLIDYYKKAS